MDYIVQWLLNLIQTIGYPGIALAMFLESFFAPIPSEAIVPLGWFLAFEGKLNLWMVILVGWVASYLGTLPFYFIGYRWHRRKINQFITKYGKYLWIKPQDVDASFDWFQKYGYAFVFFGRCIPLVRTFVSFPAGSVRMNFAFFSLLSISWSIVWSAILAGAGYALGSQRNLVSWLIKQYEYIVLGIIVWCVLVWIGWMVYHRTKSHRTRSQ